MNQNMALGLRIAYVSGRKLDTDGTLFREFVDKSRRINFPAKKY